MLFVYAVRVKSKVLVGFSDDFDAVLNVITQKNNLKNTSSIVVMVKEKYKSKKDAMIRVKQLKNKYK